MLVDIDDFEIVTAAQSLFAESPDILYRPERPRSAACHEEAQTVVVLSVLNGSVLNRHSFGRQGVVRRSRRLHSAAFPVRGLRSRPTRTRSVLDRSPMIFLTGVGSCRTRVGIARIWSPL